MPLILLVDDNVTFRSLLRTLLERAGHEVLEAAEGDEALRLHRRRPADLVLCDLFMPGKEGLETIQEIRQTSRVPIIAMTGDGPAFAAVLLRTAELLGATRVLSKPFDTETLLEMMSELWHGPIE